MLGSALNLQGTVAYKSACTAVMIEGAIFLVLALTGLRYKIIRLIPEVSNLPCTFKHISTQPLAHLFISVP